VSIFFGGIFYMEEQPVDNQSFDLAAADKAAVEKALAESEANRVAAEAEANRVAAEAEAQRVAAEAEANRVAAEAEANRVAAEAEAQRVAAEKAEAERLAAEAQRVAAEKAEAERVAAEKAEAERVAAEKAETERLAAEAQRVAAEAQRVAAEKAEAERVAAEKAEAQRVAAEKAESERVAAEAQRVAAEKAESERVAAEAQRVAAEKAESERLAAEAQRVAAEAEAQRVAAEAEAQRVAAEKAESERLAAEAQRVAAEKAESERLAAEAQRVAAEAQRVAEAERLAAEAERLANEKAEAQAERVAAEKVELERVSATIDNQPIQPVKDLINEIEAKIATQDNNVTISEVIPKIIFIVPYRDRETQRKNFNSVMPIVLEDVPTTDYKIYFVQQCDARDFNRGAIKNIGFLAMKEKYPNNYKNITFVFNDVDTLPREKNIIDYNTEVGNIKHYYGHTNTLGGIVSIKGADFEKTLGYPNFWAWGYEDNMLQIRAIQNNINIDRTQFYKVGDPNILHLNDSPLRIINQNEFNRYISITKEGFASITKIDYSIDENKGFINVTKFDTGVVNDRSKNKIYDLRNGSKPFNVPPAQLNGGRRGSSMSMRF